MSERPTAAAPSLPTTSGAAGGGGGGSGSSTTDAGSAGTSSTSVSAAAAPSSGGGGGSGGGGSGSEAAAPAAASSVVDSKEIHTYHAPWPIYGLAASNREGPGYTFRYALGSFIEEYNNKVHVVQLEESSGLFKVRGTIDHPYPTTKIMWAPRALANTKDLLATTGDYLRIWSVGDAEEVTMVSYLNNNRGSDYCAPLTSFDWSSEEPSTIATCSIDTTCTIWDITTEKIRTQLIAHDKEVNDIAFSKSKHIFGTVGSDGSLRVFDLRSLDHSTIIYETPGLTPMLRVAWNQVDTNYLATVTIDSSRVIVLDVRMPASPAAELRAHTAPVNAISWAPHSASHICTVADDNQALIWDLNPLPRTIEDPILAYAAAAEINNICWPTHNPDWVTIAFEDKIQILRV